MLIIIQYIRLIWDRALTATGQHKLFGATYQDPSTELNPLEIELDANGCATV